MNKETKKQETIEDLNYLKQEMASELNNFRKNSRELMVMISSLNKITLYKSMQTLAVFTLGLSVGLILSP